MERNMIAINKKVTEKVKTIEVTGDIIVPDIKPDIVSIITTNGNAYIYRQEVSKSKVRIDGNVDTYVIYLSETGETRSIQTTLNFIENIDSEDILESMEIKDNAKLISIETKILNERKITINAIVEVKCDVFENSQIELYNNYNELKDVEKLEEEIRVKSIVGMNKVKNSVKENIDIENNSIVTEILKTDITVLNLENKISYNKILAKADVNIKIMFLTEDNKIEIKESIFPLMSFIDIEKVSEGNICNVEYMIRNMLFKINSNEIHNISCQVDFEINCEVSETRGISIIQDMYGIKKDVQFSKKEIEVQIDKEVISQKEIIEEKILVEDIISIYHVESKVNVLNKTISGNFINYEGEIELEIYFNSDNGNVVNIKNAKMPFLTKLDIEYKNSEIRIISKQFELNNEYVNCNMELEFNQIGVNVKKVNIIENVEEREIDETDEYTMTVYFVKSGDTIWNIAKKFKVSMDSIIQTNNLERPEKINIGQKLYIVK